MAGYVPLTGSRYGGPASPTRPIDNAGQPALPYLAPPKPTPLPEGPASPDYVPDPLGAGAYSVVNGQREVGTSAFDKDVARYRDMAGASYGRPAITLDQGQADQSRGLQMGALEMLRRQGAGEAPSAAAILAQRANQNAVMHAGQQATAARSLGGRIAATNMAGQQASQAMLAGNAANANARATEISRGQGAYAGATAAARAGDIAAASTNAQLEAQQRALNEARQQRFEGMGFDARNEQQQAADRFARNQQAAELARRAQKMAAEGASDAQITQLLGAGAMAGAALLSDESAKINVHSMGGLGHLYMQRGR